MMTDFYEKTAIYLVEKEIIPEEDYSIYAFGLRQLTGVLINGVMTIVIGILFHMIWQCILFSLAYIPLRQYAGGYHAFSQRACFFQSIIMICISLWMIESVSVNVEILLVTLFLSNMLFIIKAPVESRNKPLSDREKQVFRKRTLWIAATESIVAIVCFCIGWKMACKYISFAICMTAALLLFSDRMQSGQYDNLQG